MSKLCEDKEKTCSGRREFLVTASAIAGGLILNLANVGETSAAPVLADTTVTLDEKSPLNTVGGSQVIEIGGNKVIVARTGENSYSAVSAKCTHKGATLKYDDAAKQFSCPSHSSKFGIDGAVAKGPAKDPLKTYKSKTASLIISE